MKNTQARLNWFPIVTLFTLLVSGCVVAQPAGNQKAFDSTVTLPLVAPSISDGISRYQQYCANCHTQTDAGSSTTPSLMKNISLSWLQKTSPTEMFAFLTNGSPNQGMPAFTSLSTGDRWDLVAYLLSLVAPKNALSSGQLIYQNMCQSCHGANGAGNGALATSKGLVLTDWQSEPLLTGYSNDYLFNSIRSGNSHGMSNFAVMLSDSQIWSLVVTSRALSAATNNADLTTPEQSQTGADHSQNLGYFTISGYVTNGSGGGLKNLSALNLIISDAGQELYDMTGAVTQSGSFSFVLVPYNPDWNYIAEITHAGMVYRSIRVAGQSFAAGNTVPLAIKVYDSVSDVSYLRGERLHVLLNFDTNDTIHVTESLLISNPSSYTISPADAQTPLLQFLLDAKASSISFNNFSDSQFLKLMDGKLSDWQAIPPGGVHQIVFNYELPFEGEQDIEMIAPIDVVSTMVMVENQGNAIACSGMLTADEQMKTSSPLLVFSGMNTAAGSKQVLHCFNKREIFPLVVSICALAFALFVVLLIVLDTRKKTERVQRLKGKSSKKTTLLDAVIALDDQYKAGEISADVYRAKREELIKKLEGE